MADAELTTASAPSCFWAIVALALNSALQPAGNMCGIMSTPGLRISPVLQVMNAISTLTRLTYETIQRKGRVREAAGAVARQNHLYEYNMDATSTTPTAPKPPRRFRALVFLVGILPQAIKILAVQGDIISRILALSYAVPFIMLELVDWFGVPHGDGSGSRGDSEDFEWLGIFQAFFGLKFHFLHHCISPILMTLWFAKFLFGHSLNAKSVICFALEVTSGVFTLCFIWMIKKFMETKVVFLIYSLLFAFACWLLYDNFLVPLLCGFLCYWVISVVQISFVQCVRSSSMSEDDFEYMKASLMLGSWSAAWIILYYACFYDESVTYKPDWTKWLG